MSSKGLGKPLTAQLVFAKTKSDSLQNIKNLNLWGSQLQDLSLINKMPNLEVVSLSVNKINSLKNFSVCQKLQQLYLRKNNIADLGEIRYLIKLPYLKVLWLHDNPCAQEENYREIVIKYLPNLIKLDNNTITPQERNNCQKFSFDFKNFGQEEKNLNPRNHQQSYAEYESVEPVEKKQRVSGFQNESLNQVQQSSAHKARQRQMESQFQYQQNPSSFSNARGREQNNEEKWQKKNIPRKSNDQQIKDYVNAEKEMNRNQNILMAILSLMRQLDQGSLQIIRRQADKMLE